MTVMVALVGGCETSQILDLCWKVELIGTECIRFWFFELTNWKDGSAMSWGEEDWDE